MSLVNKSFRNNQTGEVVRIVDSYQNIAITDTKEKIDTNRLLDNKYYSEHIDPKLFFNDPNTYNMFAEKIKNIDLSRIPDTDVTNESTDVSYLENDSRVRPASDESAIIYSDPEDEVEELKRKYGATVVDSSSINRQNEAFSKLLGDEAPEIKVQEVPQQVEVVRPQVRQEAYQTHQVIEDPIISIFKNAKRNIDFSINVSIDGKIPRTDFIEMMEDSYELSIIEYLADEFTSNIIKNPHLIRNKVIQEIKDRVYGKTVGISYSETKEVLETQTDPDQKSDQKPKRKYTKKNVNDTGAIS